MDGSKKRVMFDDELEEATDYEIKSSTLTTENEDDDSTAVDHEEKEETVRTIH